MLKSSFFWTDLTQASERLNRSVILYDGDPVYVEAVSEGSDGVPKVHIMDLVNQQVIRKNADSPKFERYRKLPNLGWFNSKGIPLFMERRTRTSRSHGLTNENVAIFNLHAGSGTLQANGNTFINVMFDKGFIDSHNDRFPSMERTLRDIAPGSSIAVSRKLLVNCDMDGLKWLWLGKARVGIFTGSDSLLLLPKYAFHREEIQSEKAFTLNRIREF